ncbi:DnaD domain protein [Mitsuokella sp. AF21-1AC]|uniref:DnaD domain protein n=1 Tax=Mitsuokella sp. AF21-1AC TaxID=2292235 RepID=UPI000E50994A|nr:DnaD domain protein [Mitsuokella sp. AF21-1AC]RGS72031.1 DnaD domain protein [Mitsuokella sp. AF21-1AC]
MNYVKQLNAFGVRRAGVLNAREQAMYLCLFLVANQLKWPEWFDVANSRIMREAGIKSKVTIISTRRSLEEKGFIQSIDPGHKKKTRYHLPKLYEDDAKGSKNEPIEASNGTKIVPIKTTKGTKNEPIEGARVQNLNPKGTKNEPIEGPKGTKFEPYINNINSKHISSTTAPPQDDNFRQVVEVYEKSIRPVPSPADLERLSDCLEHYGKEALFKAIDRADYRGRRSMGYIEGILRSWEQNGYDDPEEDTNGHRTAKHSGRGRKKALRFDPDAERRKWENEKSGWD